MPGCQEEEDVQKAITWLKNTVARCRRGGALGLGCQRTGREGTGPPAERLGALKERKETGGTRVELCTRKFRTWCSSLVGRVLT